MNTGRSYIIVSLFSIILLLSGCASDESKVESFITQAQEFFDQGEYQKAVIQLKNAIKIKNRSEEAHSLLNKTYLKMGNAQEAFKILIRLEQINPDNLDYKLQLGSFYLLGKKKFELKNRIDDIFAKDPNNIQAMYLNAGYLGLNQDDLEKILDQYLKIIDTDPNQHRAHMALSQIYAKQKQLSRTEKHLREAVRLEPKNITYSTALYRFLMISRRPEDAKSTAESLIKALPDKSAPTILLGNFYLGQKDFDKAEQAYLKAAEIEPENINTYMLLAKYYNSRKEFDKAEVNIQKALEIQPDNFNVKNAYADFHFINKNVKKAEELVNEILETRPNHFPSQLLKGKILAQQKKWDDAIDIFKQLISDEPESEIINLFLGSAYFEKNELNTAKPYIAKTIELNPNQLQARFILADIHYRQRDFYLAEKEINKVLDRVPDHYNANILMGNIKFGNQDLSAAKEIFQKMAQKFPTMPAAHFRLGLVNRVEKNNDAAMNNFKKALTINPNLMDVFSNIISLMAMKNQYNQAIALCDEHLKKTDQSPVIHSVIFNLKGNLLLKLNKPEQGKTVLKQSIDKNPAYLTPYFSLAQTLVKEGEIDKAIDVYKALIEKRPDQASPHGLIGNLYELKNNYELAESHYKKALELSPEYVTAANNLAFLYAQQDRELNTALELARMAKEKAGKIPAVMDTLGWVYYKKELYDNALDEFTACVEKEPQNPIFHYHLGLALNKKGKYGKAEEALKKALSIKKDFKGSEEARKVLSQL